MRRSKLEMQVDILNVLAKKGPLQLTTIVNLIDFSGKILFENLNFLTKQGLIEEVTIGKNENGYSNTSRGMAVVRFFGVLEKTLSVKERTSLRPFLID